MDWIIEIKAEEQLARVTVRGEFVKDDCIAQKKALITHGDWAAGKPLLIDYRQATFSSTTLEILREVVDFHQTIDERIGNGKMALLMNSPRDFGLARQYEMIAEGKVLSQIRVFLDEAEAFEWLAGGLNG